MAAKIREDWLTGGTGVLMGLVPWRLWAGLLIVAVGGSCVYGASLSLVLTDWKGANAALWLALSAGLAWCVFLPTVWNLTRGDVINSTTACLWTMAAGEAVLTSGALLNAVVAANGGSAHAAMINLTVVGISNAVMAAVLCVLLRRLGVAVRDTLLAWVLALNGSGALFFWAFAKLLHGL